MSEQYYTQAIRNGWNLRRNPTWNSRIRGWLRYLIAAKSYSSPDRCFRKYATPTLPLGEKE